jgi:hypothetical protein
MPLKSSDEKQDLILKVFDYFEMNKTETSLVSLIAQPNFVCSCYVAIQDVLGKIEGTAAVLIIDV